MDPSLAERFRQKLLEMREQVTSQLERLNQGGFHESLRDSIQELSSYDNHPGDIGSEVFERAKDLGLKDNALIQLRKIDDALKKIAAGTYGRCDICGREITLERLEAVPESTLCLEHRKEVEGRGDRYPRPLEEDVIAPPYGGLFHDNYFREQPDAEDEQMFDGEDAWQELARWNEHTEPARAGSYYGESDLDEDRGFVEHMEHIPYVKGADGMFYEDVGGIDDEGAPEEVVLGDEGWDRVLSDDHDQGKRP